MRERVFFLRKRRLFNTYLNLFAYLLFRYHHLFFGRLITKGKKVRAFNKFIQLKKIIKIKEMMDPLLIFLVAMINITPIIFSRPLKLGAQLHGVPTPIKESKQVTFAVKWAMQCSKTNKGLISIFFLADNLILAVYDKGLIVEKKLLLYKTGALNRHLIRFFK